MSELAEERSIGGGAKRAKIRVNAVMHGRAGAFGLIDIYCVKLLLLGEHHHNLIGACHESGHALRA